MPSTIFRHVETHDQRAPPSGGRRAGLLEYGLLMALIAIFAIGAVSTRWPYDQHGLLAVHCLKFLAPPSRRSPPACSRPR